MSNEHDEGKVNRRGFMQSAVCGAGLAGIFPASLAELDKPALPASEEEARRNYLQKLEQIRRNRSKKILIEEPGPPPWIYAQFNHDALAAALEKCADSICHQVFWGAGYGLMALPSFIRVIDRMVVGKKMWQNYLEFIDDLYDGKPSYAYGEVFYAGKGKEPPIILIDSLGYFPDPKPSTLRNGSLKLYRCSPDDISEITRIIRAEHAKIHYPPFIRLDKLQRKYKKWLGSNNPRILI